MAILDLQRVAQTLCLSKSAAFFGNRQAAEFPKAGNSALPAANPKSQFQNPGEDALITIEINGDSRQVPDRMTLTALLEWLKIPRDRVAVERNLEIVPKGDWDTVVVAERDRLEIVHFIGGGR